MSDNTRDKNVLRLYQKIREGVKDSEEYHTGLVGEALIVSSYKQMPIADLEKMQFIIGKILKVKKEMRRVNEVENASKE